MSDYDFVVNDVEYTIKMPNAQQRQEAQRIYNRAFNEIAIKDGCMLRDQVESFARERGILTDERDAKIKELQSKMADIEDKLDLGGIELAEAKDLAIELQNLRGQLLLESASFAALMSNCAEKQAEAVRDDYLMSICICRKPGTPVCKNIDDFLDKQDDAVIQVGVNKFNEMWYGISSDFMKDFPENKFLIEYGFMNENFELLNEDGKLPEKPKKEKQPFLNNGKPVEKQNR